MLYEIEYDRENDDLGDLGDFSHVIEAPRWHSTADGDTRFGKGTLSAIADYGRANGAHGALVHEYWPMHVERDGTVRGARSSVLCSLTIEAAGFTVRSENGRTVR